MRYDRRAVQRMREAKGWTRGHLARRARVTERTVIYIERGYSAPLATTLAKLAGALGVEIGAFFQEPAKNGPRERGNAGVALTAHP